MKHRPLVVVLLISGDGNFFLEDRPLHKEPCVKAGMGVVRDGFVREEISLVQVAAVVPICLLKFADFCL